MLEIVGQVGTQLGRVVERDRARRHMTHHALHDALTGLPNRVLLLERLGSALARGRRNAGEVALLFIDLDRFKSVNDADGHEAGDAVLVETAMRLDSALRPGDTVARLGGDEFVVLCEDVDTRGALDMAERLHLRLREPYRGPRGQQHLVSASIGLALSTEHSHADGLLADADAAMYRAKGLGGGRHELFNEDMRDLLLEPRPRRARAHPGAGQRRAAPALPASGRAGGRGGDRRRGADPVGGPRPRFASSGRVHPDRRGDGPDPANR